ncbi:MAG TPA: DUF3108 domain-containing protein [Gemmatimonadales bacterium]|jgi:hypothetical protein|nr:DUF3108 domain-containing protein [Gemmatimonadales bacterium]
MPVSVLIVRAALLARLAGPAPAPVAPYPFAVGETLSYDAKLGYFPIGSATASVGRAREQGADAFVFAFAGAGGPPGVRVQYELTSWTRSTRFASLRFHRKMVQGNSVEEQRYQIVPDSSRYRLEGGGQDWMAPRDALDELAFMYYLRTAPLESGRSYTISRYFRSGYNPIQVRVVGRESVTLYDNSSVPCFVLEVTTRGTTMRVRLTDDARRLPVQVEVPMPFGTVSLDLIGVSTAPGSSRSPTG